jgi:hypothetical protein
MRTVRPREAQTFQRPEASISFLSGRERDDPPTLSIRFPLAVIHF